MIRIIIIGILVGLFLILTLPILFVEWIVGLFNIQARYRQSMKIIRWAFRVALVVSGTKLDVYGKENIPDDHSVLFVGNHRSIFDILILYSQLKNATGIIAKKSLKKFPIFNVWMSFIGCLFLDRTDIKAGLKMVLEATERMKNGLSILIFPEGTRNKVNDTFLPFKGGSFKIAEKSESDIVPFAIINSSAILEDHKPKIKKAHVVLVVGEAIPTKDLDKDAKKALPSMVRDRVIELYQSKRETI